MKCSIEQIIGLERVGNFSLQSCAVDFNLREFGFASIQSNHLQKIFPHQHFSTVQRIQPNIFPHYQRHF